MNNKNLKSLKTRTAKERKEIAKKGAIASAKAKQEKKIIKEEILKRLGDKDMGEMVNNLIDRAKVDNRAFEVLRDSIGQKPTNKVNIDQDEEVKISVHIVDEDGNIVN